MVQSTDTGNRDDISPFAWHDTSLLGRVLFESQMRSVLVIVVNIRPNHAPKLLFINRDDMFQAIPAETADPALGEAVLPWGAKRCAYLFEPEPINSIPEPCPVDSIIVGA